MRAENPVCLPFQPPRPEPATLDRAISAYLQSMQLRTKRGKLSAAHFDNVNRTLRRFGDAWRVVFTDGRQALLPRKSAPDDRPARWRLRPPPRTAEDQTEAIAWAAELFPGPDCAAKAHHNGATLISAADTDDLDRWILANPQWKTQNAQANICAAILNCFSWYDDTTGCRSPYRRRLAPKFHCERRRNATQEEYDLMTGPGCCDPMRLALWCLWHVDGIRPSELYGLRWPHCKFRTATDSTLEYPHKTKRYTGKDKILPLTPRTLAFFLELQRLRGQTLDDYVFHNTHGTPWLRNAFDHHFERRRDWLGLDKTLTPYTFRHGFATDAVRAGADRSHIATLLGHRGTRMLDVYSHAEDHAEHLVKVACEVEGKVEGLRQRKRRKTPEVVQGELF